MRPKKAIKAGSHISEQGSSTLYFYSGEQFLTLTWTDGPELKAVLINHRRQVLALCLTGTNTFSSLLAARSFSIPAFQTLWNYILLNLVYTSYTLYRYGWKKYLHLILHDGWKYLILAFLDVEGNYFVVLAYRYTVCYIHQRISLVQMRLTPSDNPLRPTNKFLGHSNSRPALLYHPPRPLPPHPNHRHPNLHRRRRHPLRLRPHHAGFRLQRRYGWQPVERGSFRPSGRDILRSQQRR